MAFAAASASAAGGIKFCIPNEPNHAFKTPERIRGLHQNTKSVKYHNPGTRGGRQRRSAGAGKFQPGPEGKEGPEGKNAFSESELNELKRLKEALPYIKFVSSGVGGKPTIQVSGANLQIVNGEGKENSVNGVGNLVVGYDGGTLGGLTQTGSHDLP